ncbi:F0F1 ATP synthase subunit gamma [Novosphingobium pentaromativorans]|uniref:F-type H+-transporting ATPase subunit gamma n=1 Tax=Novosphingobium pentaromativorans US6-1 TaxID=1088721 RepID=G6EHH2_9SPHN|nr:FoF1 ATP synthase subunit gamma [Novosphingobium pentaromativorans]AIT81875.1 ATPase [Novosphingobium pentaromativorans US6-1]EHJ59461.1 F-type H+-transporting ATPase subunit gamma [Novosphingobium pentaromativorans US6-1]
MAERLAEVEARIESVHQLSSVIGAVRAIAAARLREAKARLPGIQTYARTIGEAIAQALALVPQAPVNAAKGGNRKSIVLAIGAEQGFVGNFNGRLLDALTPLTRSSRTPSCELLLVGSHAASAASERVLTVNWSAPMATHAQEIAGLANRIADALFDRIANGEVSEVLLVHAATDAQQPESPVQVRPLLPFDFSRFAPLARAQPPIIQLPPERLLAQLADEYVFAEICEALVLSFAAENEARMQAMVAARENVARRSDELAARARLMRQEQITEEVIELASGGRRAIP